MFQLLLVLVLAVGGLNSTTHGDLLARMLRKPVTTSHCDGFGCFLNIRFRNELTIYPGLKVKCEKSIHQFLGQDDDGSEVLLQIPLSGWAKERLNQIMETSSNNDNDSQSD